MRQLPQDVIHPREIAERTGLGINSVYSGFEAGEIPARRVGRRWVCGREAFERWLQGRDVAEEQTV